MKKIAIFLILFFIVTMTASCGFEIRKNEHISRNDIIEKLINIQYERNDFELSPGRFRVKGDTIDIIPGYYDEIIRLELFGDSIEQIRGINKITGEITDFHDYFYLDFRTKHYIELFSNDEILPGKVAYNLYCKEINLKNLNKQSAMN